MLYLQVGEEFVRESHLNGAAIEKGQTIVRLFSRGHLRDRRRGGGGGLIWDERVTFRRRLAGSHLPVRGRGGRQGGSRLGAVGKGKVKVCGADGAKETKEQRHRAGSFHKRPS